jgi:aspartyl-tRNA(Asn)/glutamyl-tRNA(Gln) amidotransferase subunit B
MMPEFQTVIGLEVHAEFSTLSKMFCGCAVVDSIEAEPNTSVCEICTGMPGTLPVINARAVEYAIRVALALNCEIAPTSVFARKNYFYPDLPKGFQISQYAMPLAQHGCLTIDTPNGEKDIRIRRVHLEEDTGKLFHRDGYSLIDFNRSGIPLLEIVSEPDMNTVEEVRAFATSLRSVLRYLKVSSGDMEKGAIRFEANVSVRPQGSSELGTRTEIKNLNSFRWMVQAVSYEVTRQIALLRQGKQVMLETLGWDVARGVTFPQRSKEEAHDYRYFPEPDLPPLVIDTSWIETLRETLPEMPLARCKRITSQHDLSPSIAAILTSEKEIADFFETAVGLDLAPPLKLAHWLTGDLFALLNQESIEIQQSKVTPRALAELVSLVENGKLSPSSGKAVLAEIFSTGLSAGDILSRRDLTQVSDKAEIDPLIALVLRDNPQQVAKYLAGKEPLFQWLFGQVMAAAKGRANPQVVQERLKAGLKPLRNAGADE